MQEPLDIHNLGSSSERRAKVQEALERVGLNPEHYNRFPHEFSGGQRQRIGIARALVLEPKVIVCDEPVSALDVSVQAQVVNLLLELQERLGLTVLFVAHDLRLVRHLSHRVAVMYLGRVVEVAPTEELFRAPKHPYTQALLAAAPTPDPARRADAPAITGELPSPLNVPSGCAFRTRCPHAFDRCAAERPALLDVEGAQVACHLYSAPDSAVPG